MNLLLTTSTTPVMFASAPEEDGFGGGQTPPLYILVPKQNTVLMVFEAFMTKCICKEKHFPQSERRLSV